VTYTARRAPRTSSLDLRGIRHRIVRWGPAHLRPAVFLHGWADTATTFQFLIDAFDDDQPVVALDWRGFGESTWLGTPYWFPDYFADLDALLEAVHPHAPAVLLGHSMGGNIAATYAGIRPERVRAVINLEGVGLKRTTATDAPGRYRRWLEELREGPRFGEFRDLDQFTAVLMRRNPRLTAERARFVAESWSRVGDDGVIRVNTDPMHRLVNPVLYRREESEACWRACVARVLLVLGGLSEFRSSLGADGTDEYFRSLFADLTIATLPTAGHMLHHDTPEALAALVEPWLRPVEGATP
jgi:pimeloyl-ACP methyl ester carboxylesterase